MNETTWPYQRPQEEAQRVRDNIAGDLKHLPKVNFFGESNAQTIRDLEVQRAALDQVLSGGAPPSDLARWLAGDNNELEYQDYNYA